MTSQIHRLPARRRMFPEPERAIGLLTLLLLLVWRGAGAELLPAEGFFNSGAQFYISNNVPEALKHVEAGLKIYPDDVKLKKLEELLKQQQQQQQHNQQNQQQQDQQQKDQQQKQDQQKEDKPDQKQDEPQKKDSGDQPKDESQEPQQQQPLKPGELTPDEAKKLLDGQKSKEQLLQMKPADHPRNPLRPVKDW